MQLPAVRSRRAARDRRPRAPRAPRRGPRSPTRQGGPTRAPAARARTSRSGAGSVRSKTRSLQPSLITRADRLVDHGQLDVPQLGADVDDAGALAETADAQLDEGCGGERLGDVRGHDHLSMPGDVSGLTFCSTSLRQHGLSHRRYSAPRSALAFAAPASAAEVSLAVMPAEGVRLGTPTAADRHGHGGRRPARRADRAARGPPAPVRAARGEGAAAPSDSADGALLVRAAARPQPPASACGSPSVAPEPDRSARRATPTCCPRSR